MKWLLNFLTFGNAYAEQYRNNRAKALAFLCIVFAAAFFFLEATKPELLDRQYIQGTVIEVNYAGQNTSDENDSVENMAYIKIKVPNQDVISTVFIPSPHPKVGDQVPLILERYSDDNAKYVVQFERWAEGH